MWSDEGSSQFRSRFVFALMTHYENSFEFEWHCNEVSHGESPMVGAGGTIKPVAFGLVKSNKITINSAEEFAREA